MLMPPLFAIFDARRHDAAADADADYYFYDAARYFR